MKLLFYILLFSLLLLTSCVNICYNPEKIEKHYHQGMIYYEQDEYELAIKEFRYVVNNKPAHILARTRLAECYEQIGDNRRAIESYREAIAYEQDNPQLHLALGNLYLKIKFYYDAQYEYKQALELDNTSIDAHIGLGNYYEYQFKTHWKSEFYEKATNHYEQIIKIDSSNVIAHLRLGYSNYQLGEYTKSLEHLGILHFSPSSTLSDNSNILDMCIYSAMTYQALEDYESAFEFYERAINLLSEEEQYIFSDISIIAYPIELELWGRIPSDLRPEDKTAFYHRFWKRRDPTPTTEINERLCEHYRRLFYVREHLSLPEQNIFGWETARGQVYVRYGKPLHRAHLLVSNEIKSAGPATAIGPIGSLAPAVIEAWNYGNGISFTFEDKVLNNRFGFVAPHKFNILKKQVPATYTPDYEIKELDYERDVLAFKGEKENYIRLCYYIKLPSEQFAIEDTLNFKMELVLFDQEWNEQYRIERLFTHTVIEDGENEIIEGLSMEVKPDKYILAFSINELDSSYTAIEKSFLTLQRYISGKLDMSDLLLAKIPQTNNLSFENNPHFQHKGKFLLPVVDAIYFPNQEIYLYYEIYGLSTISKRSHYQIDYTIRSYRGNDGFWSNLWSSIKKENEIDYSISHRIEEWEEDNDIGKFLFIELGNAPKGDYEIILIVKDLRDERITTSSKRFQIK